jgi:excisionase family DNA binding protein
VRFSEIGAILNWSDSSAGNEQWLSLREAAAELSVHPTTLRRWADNGDLPCMLTPGGHRRFAAADLARFAHSRQALRQYEKLDQVWADEAVSHVRQEVVQHQGDRWLSRLDEQARLEMRGLSQELMGLTLQYLAGEANEQVLLAEAASVGRQYGRFGLAQGLPLVDVLQASIFFRDMLVETALQLPEQVRVPAESNLRLLRRINTLLNDVHLAIAEVYDHADPNSLPGN